jgi:DNA-directed RNA polymerase specialized sigma24 family protein
MVRRAFRRAFDDDEVDDIYANAWLGTLRALAQRHERLSDEEIRKYVLAAVANHASKELRRRRRRPTTTLDAVHAVADEGLPPDERAAKLEHGRLTRDLLSTLPPRRRAVMLLRYGWGLEPGHVCRLVEGLSPRAYRKEITRGVDELTEKLRLVEKGEWCADREPILKAYAAGLADPDQERQAQQHLSHCRHCTDFVAKLSGHLHDMGGSVAISTAAEAMHDGRFSLADRIGDVAHRVREHAAGVFGSTGDGAPDGVAQAATASGSARGAGAAGTGALAKLAGIGTAGKLATVCLGGGAAATACLAAGVLPASLPDLHGGSRTVASRAAPERHHASSTPQPVVGAPNSQVVVEPPAPTSPAPSEEGAGGTGEPPPTPASEPEPQPATPPIDPATPPPQQEFGVASAASSASSQAPSSSSASSSAGESGSATQQEFGP